MSMMQPTGEQGGYRKPTNPAVASGPGALSQRTDGSPSQPATYISGLPQGQGQATFDQQVAAPMYKTPQVEAVGIGAFDVTPITADSKFPDENIMTGSSFTPNTGESALLNLPYQQPTLMMTLAKTAQNDPTGDTELIMRMLQDRGIG
jgi:hypothetical protein